MNSMLDTWHDFLASPLFGITLTVAAYTAALRLWHRFGRSALLTPVLVAIALVVVFLELSGVSYQDYLVGGSFLSFLLGPATVALAVPLYRASSSIRQLALPVLAGVACGCLAAMATGIVVVRALNGGLALEATIAPKSATTPIAIVLADSSGGIASLAAVLTVLTGVLGAVFGPMLLGMVGVSDPRLRGLALGVSSHGIGTSRAIQEGPVQGAFAALAMAMSGVLTALALPAVLRLLG